MGRLDGVEFVAEVPERVRFGIGVSGERGAHRGEQVRAVLACLVKVAGEVLEQRVEDEYVATRLDGTNPPCLTPDG